MATNNYLTFQEFETEEDARRIGDVLEEYNIPVIIEKTPDLLDNVIIGRQYNNYVKLRIPPECFEQAQQLLIENTVVELDKVDRNYTLFALSNDELLDVVAKPDQWGAYNYNLAKLILQERNVPIDHHKAEGLHKEYIGELYQQRPLNATWLIFGYGFSILALYAILTNNARALLFVYFFYLLPGIMGIVLGLIIITTKKTLPDGTQLLSYNGTARKHGLLMLALAALAVIIILIRAYLSLGK